MVKLRTLWQWQTECCPSLRTLLSQHHCCFPKQLCKHTFLREGPQSQCFGCFSVLHLFRTFIFHGPSDLGQELEFMWCHILWLRTHCNIFIWQNCVEYFELIQGIKGATTAQLQILMPQDFNTASQSVKKNGTGMTLARGDILRNINDNVFFIIIL